ncbi:MAG TPA: hypothetical protein PK760_15605, partial [Flavobacteriales bacterium]|nr:hypothetical protein [Flavobacteriales bacterium]
MALYLILGIAVFLFFAFGWYWYVLGAPVIAFLHLVEFVQRRIRGVRTIRLNSILESAHARWKRFADEEQRRETMTSLQREGHVPRLWESEVDALREEFRFDTLIHEGDVRNIRSAHSDIEVLVSMDSSHGDNDVQKFARAAFPSTLTVRFSK